MRYIDSGNRNVEQALGSWLENQLTPEVNELRWQTGFFGLDGLSPFVSTLQQLATADLSVRALIGSNEGETLKAHVARLVEYLGLPRTGAHLGIISYAGSFYHPKIYHLSRTDGTQAAYVGSANLTLAGIGSRNVEAGLLLDTREGDQADVLDQIATSVDEWFGGARTGIEIVRQLDDLEALEEAGILATAPPVRGTSSSGGQIGQSGSGRPLLQPLIRFPSLSAPVKRKPQAVAATEEGYASAEAIPAPEPVAANSLFDETALVLVAEIGGPGRWTQANFPKATIRSFFQVEPGTHQKITLFNIAADGTLGQEERPPNVAVASQNYRFELHSVKGLSYPTSGRPIGVFLRTGRREFKYVVIMPDDPNHAQVSTSLAAMYSGPARQLKREIISAERLKEIWPDCPFWLQ